MALLGMDGAEGLGAGGHALLRLEGRMPYPGWAPYVPADLLARLVHLMGTRARGDSSSQADAPAAAPPDEPVDSEESPDMAETDDEEPAAEEDVEETVVPAAGTHYTERLRPPATPSWASARLRELRAAPIRVRCFGACEVWPGERLLRIGDPELLLLLAVHPVTGIASETVADMLWDEARADPPGDLRKKRSKLRLMLRRLVPHPPADPLPGDAYKGDKVVLLDTLVVSSDVHEFIEVLDLAHGLQPADAIEDI